MLGAIQIYFSEQTKAQLDPRSLPFNNSDTCTKYFENSVIREVIESGAHKTSDYFGVISWQFRTKTRLTLEQVIERMEADQKRRDVYSFFRTHQAKNVWIKAESWHPGILKAGQYIMDKAGIDVQLDKIRTHNIYQNHFFTKPEIYSRYVSEFLAPCMDAMNDESDSELQAMLNVNSGYKKGEIKRTDLSERLVKITGYPYYTLHTFVCERFFATWLALHPEITLKHI